MHRGRLEGEDPKAYAKRLVAPRVKIILAPGAIMPQYAHDTDSGADLFSMETVVLNPGEAHAFSTGVQLELPAGYEAQVRSKSGLATNQRVFVLNSPGTVDNGYRGDLKVILYNASEVRHRIVSGQKIAQLVVTPYVQAAFVVDEQLSTTDRGDGGLGSTGLEAKPVPFPPVSPAQNVPQVRTYTTGLGPCIGDNTLHGGKGPTGYVSLSRFVFDNEDGKRLEHRGDD